MRRGGIIVKTEADIVKMRRSCAAAAEVLAALKAMVSPQITTGELDDAARDLIKGYGGKSPFLGYRGFPGHICVSVNEEIVHGIPGQRRIEYGDIVSLDVGIVLDGWVGDNAATVAVGVVPPGVQKLLRVGEEALGLGIAQARANNRVGDISAAVQRHVEAHGFSVVREFVGHGVGRTMHEDPQVPNFGRAGEGAKLKPGVTLAIEPMLNMGLCGVEVLGDGWTAVTVDRKPSAHFEHTVLITEGDPEILTCPDKKPSALKAK
jgi:methionyl aminopeptidase